MPPSPSETFRRLHEATAAHGGARLFTVSRIDYDAQLSRRAYTSHPAEYPVSGTKPMVIDGWGRQVIEGQKTFVANSTDGFSPYFPDHPLINALGCASAINIPVVESGKVVGTVNLLDVENHFTPERVASLEALVARERPALVAALVAMPL
ncbi:MAG: GAF domain-containing protein [Paracoccaceae bacterium]|jgi:hypothetical protein